MSKSQNISGIILLSFMVAAASVYLLKNIHFEVFYILHILFYVGVFIVSILHSAVLAITIVFWGIDLFLRYIITIHKNKAYAEILSGDVIRISMPRRFTYTPSQYCFICIPAISSYQFHPFTISTAPHQEEIFFHIRALGDWTSSLNNLVKDKLKNNKENNNGSNDNNNQTNNQTVISSKVLLDVVIEGPFGLSSIDLESPRYVVFLLVSGGIGITPTQSMFNHLFHQYETKKRVILKCYFIWSVKDRAMLDGMNNILTGTSRVTNISSGIKNDNLTDQDDAKLPISFQPNLIPQRLLTRSIAWKDLNKFENAAVTEPDSSQNQKRSIHPEQKITEENDIERSQNQNQDQSSDSMRTEHSSPFVFQFHLTSLRNKQVRMNK